MIHSPQVGGEGPEMPYCIADGSLKTEHKTGTVGSHGSLNSRLLLHASQAAFSHLSSS